MIQLFIDYATNKIVGYNTISSDRERDAIYVNDSELPRLIRLSTCDDNLYYIDSQIVEKEEPDDHYRQLKELNQQYAKAQENLTNEHSIFMDNILSGMSMEDAVKISNHNREEAARLEEKRKAFDQKAKEKTQSNILAKFVEEEKDICYKYFLSMVTVVRDENDYIEEWIRYYIEELGFDHFYIYDNESGVPVKEYLESVDFRYWDRITFLEWKTSQNTQEDSHMDFLSNYAKETRWFLAADPDEYVLIKDKSKNLKEFLEENSRYAAVECVWHHFNANGQEKRTAGTDMERFTTEVDWDYAKGHGKYFAQSNRVERFHNYSPHMRLEAQVLTGEKSKADKYFQLNHYYTRSYEEWVKKIERGTAVPYAKRKYSEFFELNPDMKYLDTGDRTMQTYGSREGGAKNGHTDYTSGA